MKDKKEYSKEELWKNTKTNSYEPIPEMNARKLSYKLDLLTSKINTITFDLTKLKNNLKFFEQKRKIILEHIVKHGNFILDKNKLPNRFIFLSGDNKEPIVVNPGVLEENGIDLSIAIKLKLLVKIEETKMEEDL